MTNKRNHLKIKINGKFFSERISRGNNWTRKKFRQAREKHFPPRACDTVSIGNGDANAKIQPKCNYSHSSMQKFS